MGKKKKLSIVFFVMLLFIGIQVQTNAQKRPKAPPRLMKITSVMHKNGIHVNHWELYTKRIGGFIQGRKGYVRMVEGLKSDLPSFRWTHISKDYEGNLKITGIYTDKSTNVNERFTLLAFRKAKHWRTYMIYEASSNQWVPKKWIRFSSTFYDRVQQYFGKNPTIFTCVSGRADDKMNFVLFKRAQQLLQSFSAVPVEKLQEKTFVSISAYTEQWKKESILTKHHHKMNLQVGLRTVNGNTTVTIGTPIITTEY